VKPGILAVGSMLGSCVVAAPGLATEANPSNHKEPLSLGVAVNGGVAIYDYDETFGPWLEGGGYAFLNLSSVLYLRGDLSGAYSSYSRERTFAYHDYFVDEHNTDDGSLLAVLGRATLGLRFSSSLAWELGALVGPAFFSVDSVQCGESSSAGLALGGATGPALRLGDRLTAGLFFQVFFAPEQRCTNGGVNPNTQQSPWPHFYDEDDGRFAVTARFGYLL
jgi:hypothetical protein